MKSITSDELAKVVEEQVGLVVSMYLTPLTGAEARQNSAQLKGLLRTAEHGLRAAGMHLSEAQRLLAPAMNLFEPAEKRGELGPGLAVLLGEDRAYFWNLANSVDARCEVGKYFYVIPLIESLSDDMKCFVLAVSQNQVRMLHVTRSEFEEVSVPGLPPDRGSAVRLEDTERTLNAHVGRSQVPGRGDLMYHGHGGAPDADKGELEQYLRAINRAVAKFMMGNTEPLVFAGVDYLFPIYQQANTYANLLSTPITGNPELWSKEAFFERAWPLIEPSVQARREAAQTKYGDMIAQGRTANGLEDVLPAAQAGAIETLIIDPRATRRGTFDPESLTVRFDDGSPRQDSEDLANLAAVLVLRSSGAVELPATASNIPGDGEVAAVLRYPFTASSGVGGSAAKGA